MFKKIYSRLIRLDKLKIKKSKGLKKVFYFLILKFINLIRWIYCIFINPKEINLDDFFNKIKIFWYGGNEGHTQQVVEETMYLAQVSTKAKNILEIGFNGGHSAETMLQSSDKSYVLSVDIGFHHYVKFGYYFLKKKYKNRVKLVIGNSKKILPQLVGSNKKFDLIFIDGGHDYDIVKSDLNNAIKMSDKNTLIIVDDVYYPVSEKTKEYFDDHNNGPTKAWLELIKEEKITEVEYVQFVTNNTNLRSLVAGKLK